MTSRRSFIKVVGAAVCSVAAALYAPGVLAEPCDHELKVDIHTDYAPGPDAVCYIRYREVGGDWKRAMTRERDEEGNFVVLRGLKSAEYHVDWVQIMEPRA